MQYVYGADTYQAWCDITALAKQQGAALRWVDGPSLKEQDIRALFEDNAATLFSPVLVVVRDIAAAPKATQTVVKEYVSRFPKHLVLWDRVAPDRKTALFKALRPKGTEYAMPSFVQLTAWVTNEATSRASVIEPAAVQALVQRVGLDRWRLLSEIEKYAVLDGPITKDIVEEQTTAAPSEAEVFPMLDALAAGRGKVAMQEAEKLLQTGSSELYIMSMLAYQFRSLWLIAILQREGLSQEAIAKRAGMHPYAVQKNMSAARRQPASFWYQGLARIVATDFAIKQGTVDPRTALIMLLTAITPQTVER